jgi:hypothetical protein
MEQPRYCPKCHQTFDPVSDSVWAFYSTEKTTATCESQGFGDCDPDSDYAEKEQPKNQEPVKR